MYIFSGGGVALESSFKDPPMVASSAVSKRSRLARRQGRRHGLLQHGDLSAVIEAVLHDAVKQIVEIVRAAGYGSLKFRVLKSLHGLHEPIGVLEHSILCGRPSRI